MITFITYDSLTKEILEQCSKLYSEHYGFWLNNKCIKLTPTKLKTMYLYDKTCGVVLAEIDGQLIGHSFYAEFENCLWITQLVVHKDFRRRGIGTSLVSKILEIDWKYVGIASSNPYAIQILKKVTNGIICSLEIVEIIMQGCTVPYLKGKNFTTSTIDSQFDIRHDILGDELAQGHELLCVVKRS